MSSSHFRSIVKNSAGIFFILLFLGVPMFVNAQERDTLIILPLGNARVYPEKLTSNVKSLEAGNNLLSVISTDNNARIFSDDFFYNDYNPAPSIGDKVRSIKSGDVHSVVLYGDSTLGQFYSIPGLTMFYPEQLRKVVEIESGPKMSSAINSKSIMYTWAPRNMVKKLNIPLKIYGVKTNSIGQRHIAFINIKNKVFVWGDQSFGKGNIPTFKTTPAKIVSGDHHVMVLDQAGQVYAWGNNMLGQCAIPGNIKEKVKLIDAAQHRSLAVTVNNEVYVWGMNTSAMIDLKTLGTVKYASLANNYLAVLVSSDDKRIQEWQKATQSNAIKSTIIDPDLKRELLGMKVDTANGGPSGLALDSLRFLLELLLDKRMAKDSNYAQEYLKMNYSNQLAFDLGSNNSIDVLSDANSILDMHDSESFFEFLGSNNQITIINKNTNIRRKNVKHRVIIKGSGKKITIVNDGSEDLENQNLLTILDLDKTGISNEYPEEYLENKTDQNINIMTLEPINLEGLPTSWINEPNVSDGNYWYNGDPVCRANEYNVLASDVPFWTDSFEKARALFYIGNAKDGIAALKEDPTHGLSQLALFEIYYYGLFHQEINLAKANVYYNQFLKLK